MALEVVGLRMERGRQRERSEGFRVGGFSV